MPGDAAQIEGLKERRWARRIARPEAALQEHEPRTLHLGRSGLRILLLTPLVLALLLHAILHAASLALILHAERGILHAASLAVGLVALIGIVVIVVVCARDQLVRQRVRRHGRQKVCAHVDRVVDRVDGIHAAPGSPRAICNAQS